MVVGRDSEEFLLNAPSVILTAGGYEASRELSRQYLGAIWERARVKGTPFDIGDMIKMAHTVSAKLVSDWLGCHSLCWDANAPADMGDRELNNQYTKVRYPLDIMVNADGMQFVDEGQDFRSYRYTKFGRAIPSHWVVLHFRYMTPFLQEEYGNDIVEKIVMSGMEELTDKVVEQGLQDKTLLLKTVVKYNLVVDQHQLENPKLQWNPGIKDGLSTQSLTMSLPLLKSNWTISIIKISFLAVKVACVKALWECKP
ncbi:hypothetical protein V8B97DRAFT_2005908 [Scleroderma yunnanense]